MDKEFIESLLLSYVDVVFVDSNPAKIDNVEIFKKDGKLIKNISSEEYNLIKLDIDDINCQIIDEFSKLEPTEVKFYSSNIIGRLFKIKKFYNLYKELETLDSNNWIITNRYIYDNFLSKRDINVYINELMVDRIVVGSRNDKMIVKVDSSIEYYLDKSKIRVIGLK